MAQVLTVVIQPLNYDHKFPRHGTAGGGDDFIGQSRVTQLIKQGKKRAAWGAAQRACGVGACQGALGQRGASLLGPLSDVAALALVLCRGGGGSMSAACVWPRASSSVLGVESGTGGRSASAGLRAKGRQRDRCGMRPALWLWQCPAVLAAGSGAGLRCSDLQG